MGSQKEMEEKPPFRDWPSCAVRREALWNEGLMCESCLKCSQHWEVEKGLGNRRSESQVDGVTLLE